jgi:hypothetical protein
VSIEPELHATSDAVLANLDRLRALELEKRKLPIGSPRLVDLANEIEQLAATVLGATDLQTDLAKEAAAKVREGDLAPDATIESMAVAPRDVHAVLADWREAERRLGEVDGSSAEASRLHEQIEGYRREYRRAHEAAVRKGSQPE